MSDEEELPEYQYEDEWVIEEWEDWLRPLTLDTLPLEAPKHLVSPTVTEFEVALERCKVEGTDSEEELPQVRRRRRRRRSSSIRRRRKDEEEEEEEKKRRRRKKGVRKRRRRRRRRRRNKIIRTISKHIKLIPIQQQQQQQTTILILGTVLSPQGHKLEALLAETTLPSPPGTREKVEGPEGGEEGEKWVQTVEHVCQLIPRDLPPLIARNGYGK